MAEQTKNNYEFTTRDGKFTFKVLKPKGIQSYSITGSYPMIAQTENGLHKYTRKETIKWCVATALSRGRL